MASWAFPQLLDYGIAGLLGAILLTGVGVVVRVLWKDNLQLRAEMKALAITHAAELKAVNDALLALAKGVIETSATHTATIKNMGNLIDASTKQSEARLQAIQGLASTTTILVDRIEQLFSYTKDIFRGNGRS